jgi:murein tripeptide amidase MpaA
MIYNAMNEFDCNKALERIKYFIANKKKFELIEKKPLRSLSQNNYLHLILSYYALEYGETMEYIKEEVFKRQVNLEIFYGEYVNQKTGLIRAQLRSTSDLDSREMTEAINRFRDYASKEAGIYLPTPEDMLHLEEIEKEITNNK